MKKLLATTAAAFTLAASMFMSQGCGTKGDEPEEIAKLGDMKNSHLVKGTNECMKVLVDNGKTSGEAAKVCSDLEAQARAKYVEQHHSSDGFSNAMLWYMIGHNMGSPSVYYGSSPSTGLNYLHGGTSRVAGTATPTKPPSTIKLTPTQSQFMTAAPNSTARGTITSKLSSTPGTPMRSSSGSTYTSTGRSSSSSSSSYSSGSTRSSSGSSYSSGSTRSGSSYSSGSFSSGRSGGFSSGSSFGG